MHETNIRSLDLNLLVALKALLEEKHVSRAAARLGLSQPAMSRALGKLRHVLKDHLLVKSSSGLELTSRARELYQPLLNVFSEINHIIVPPAFYPATMQGEIVIATRDYEMVSIMPKVINCLMKEAPGLSLRINPLIGDELNLLDNNQADFIMSATDSKSASLSRYTLYEEDFVCLVAADHPVIPHFTLENFIKMKHCMVTITGFGPGFVDTSLAQKGLKRDIVVRVPHFLAASYIVAESDLIVTLPRRIGQMLSQQKNMVMLEPPLSISHFSIYLYWHIRNQNHATHKWLRKTIYENC